MSRIIFLLPSFLAAVPAHAHLGHIGELAGHAHWVGLGATVVAGILAAAVGMMAEPDESDEVSDGEEAEDSSGQEVPVEARIQGKLR